MSQSRLPDVLSSWSVTDVLFWLNEIGLGHFRSIFRKQKIDGMVVQTLTDQDLERMNMKDAESVKFCEELSKIGKHQMSVVKGWNDVELVVWLFDHGGRDFISLLSREKIDGRDFLLLEPYDLSLLKLNEEEQTILLQIRDNLIFRSNLSFFPCSPSTTCEYQRPLTPPPNLFSLSLAKNMLSPPSTTLKLQYSTPPPQFSSYLSLPPTSTPTHVSPQSKQRKYPTTPKLTNIPNHTIAEQSKHNTKDVCKDDSKDIFRQHKLYKAQYNSFSSDNTLDSPDVSKHISFSPNLVRKKISTTLPPTSPCILTARSEKRIDESSPQKFSRYYSIRKKEKTRKTHNIGHLSFDKKLEDQSLYVPNDTIFSQSVSAQPVTTITTTTTLSTPRKRATTISNDIIPNTTTITTITTVTTTTTTTTTTTAITPKKRSATSPMARLAQVLNSDHQIKVEKKENKLTHSLTVPLSKQRFHSPNSLTQNDSNRILEMHVSTTPKQKTKIDLNQIQNESTSEFPKRSLLRQTSAKFSKFYSKEKEFLSPEPETRQTKRCLTRQRSKTLSKLDDKEKSAIIFTEAPQKSKLKTSGKIDTKDIITPPNQIARVQYKSLFDDKFQSMTIEPDLTYDSFMTWIAQNYGDQFVAKYNGFCGYVSVNSDDDVRRLYELACKSEVKVILHPTE
jgi:hypothetical protein